MKTKILTAILSLTAILNLAGCTAQKHEVSVASTAETSVTETVPESLETTTAVIEETSVTTASATTPVTTTTSAASVTTTTSPAVTTPTIDTSKYIKVGADKEVAIPASVKPYGEDFTAYMHMDVVTGEYYGKNMDAIFDADESMIVPYMVFVLDEIEKGNLSETMVLDNGKTLAWAIEHIYTDFEGYDVIYKAMLKVATKESFIKWAQEKGHTVTMKDEVLTGTANLLFFKDCFREYYIKKNSTELREHLWSLALDMPYLPGYVITDISCANDTLRNEQCLNSNGTRAFSKGFVIDYSTIGEEAAAQKIIALGTQMNIAAGIRI